MRQAIEAIRINAAMLERQKANVGTFLDAGKCSPLTPLVIIPKISRTYVSSAGA